MNLSKIFSDFLKKEGISNLLLGFSGGPDSTALFHLLLESHISFAVAHVNHGWRLESDEEEVIVKSKCDLHKIDFFSIRLAQSCEGSNLEERARKQRLEFFSQLCKDKGFEGVLLGHHANDQAETVLKRLLEGASLRKLKALEEKSCFQQLVIYRPLLSVRKKEIKKWLEEKEISYFLDKSNEDIRFLRSRMRVELIPLLAYHFGKEVETSLCRIGQAAKELNHFLENILIPYRSLTKPLEQGAQLDFSHKTPKTPFEWKLVVRDFFENQHCILSEFLIEQIIDHLVRASKKEKCIRISAGLVKIRQSFLIYLALKDSVNN